MVKKVSVMARKARNQDSVFQTDAEKENMERGNQKSFDKKDYMLKSILTLGLIFIISFLIMLFVWAGILKASRYIYLFLIMDIPLINSTNISDSTYTATIFQVLFGKMHLIITIILSFVMTGFIYKKVHHRIKGKKLKTDHAELNTYVGDKKKLSIEEMFQQYAIVPDAGAVSRSVSPTSIVGHAFLDNSKIKTVKLAVRDDEGNIVKNKKGKIQYKRYPMFNTELQKDSYESIGVKESENQIIYNPEKINYRKDDNGNWQTVKDFINDDWFLPKEETQRPTGVFFVETGPVNTVVIGTTRSAKGQTLVNHTIDMFSREYEKQNLFLNDPKGDLFAAFHKLLEVRGYEPIVLNLMDPSKTHQFNVLAPAIAQARIGNYDKMGTLLSTIMKTFFPVTKDDPFWGNASQALVKMLIYALIDYYLEEEKEYLQKYTGNKDEATISREIDEMWSKVTMYNVYEMISTMSRREVLLSEKAIENNDFLSKEDLEKAKNGELKEKDGKQVRVPFKSDNGFTYEKTDVAQMTELSAFFKLTDKLPINKMRIMTLQQSGPIEQLEGSEKALASIYGITMTSLLFFTEGPIKAVTSASPRQSLDPVSLAFPRRLRFKLNSDFVLENKLNGRKVNFTAYRDSQFTDQIKTDNPIDFEHTTRIDELGWCEYRFKGVFGEYDYLTEADGSQTAIPKPIYVKMEIIDDRTQRVMYKYHYEYRRGYAKTVDGKRFIRNPYNGKRIEKDGTLRFGYMVEDGKTDKGEPIFKFVREKQKLTSLANGMKVPEIEQTEALYNTRPKAIFSVTPPHLSEYIKVVIVMVSVLFDTSVAESYITDASGKPFFKTRSILDEIGNMHYNGNGIPDFQTKLSIGLGQGQEYTMVVQTLQQFRDVYGDSVDKIVQSNTAVFMYLISNDTEMLEMLSKQAGTTHRTRATNKTINEKHGQFINDVDDNVSIQYATEEEPVFTINDLLSFTTGESMVLSARHDKDNSGEKVRPNPIHNTKGSMIPMSYALHKDGHNSPMFKKALQNVEVATSSNDRDVAENIPSFEKMYEKRKHQAFYTNSAIEQYKEVNNLDDASLERMNKDTLSRTIMRIINDKMNEDKGEEQNNNNLSDKDKEARTKMNELTSKFDISETDHVSDNNKQYDSDIKEGQQAGEEKQSLEQEKLFVDGTISLEDLRQREWIKELLSEALKNNRKVISSINNGMYEHVANQGVKYIVHKASNEAIAQFNVNNTDETTWYITDKLFEVIEKEVSLSVEEIDQNIGYVNQYFNIDGQNEIYEDIKVLAQEGAA